MTAARTSEALAALHRVCFVTPRPWTATEFTALLAMPRVFLRGDGEGFVLGRAEAGEAELLTLAVAPAERRRGLGRALLAAFEAAARAAGAESAFLEVAVGNTSARALYASAGWRETGRRPRYFHHPDGSMEDALLLSCALAAG